MITINGVENNKFDFTKITKISDLIYFDGPLLSHYVNDSGDNLLFYWVDANNDYNRWMIVRASDELIRKYIGKEVPLIQLITESPDGFVRLVDIDDNCEYHNTKIVQYDDLHSSYFPEEDSYYTFEVIPSKSILAKYSNEYNSGVMEIHINGRGVRHGSIPLTVFSELTSQIDDIRKELAAKYISNRKSSFSIRSSDSDDVKENKAAQKKILMLNTNYELAGYAAASFRIFLRTANTQTTFVESTADDFASELTSLLVSGKNKEDIKSISDQYGSAIIKKYSSFIEYIDEKGLDIGIEWCNIASNIEYKRAIKQRDLQAMRTNLSEFELDDAEELRSRGKFYSINVKSGAYSFETIENENFKSNGFFDKSRIEQMFRISFDKEYDVIVNRKFTKKLGGKEKTKDTLISFIEV